MKKIKLIIPILLLVGVLLTGCTSTDKQLSQAEITTFKSATCGCCGIWTRYAEKEGFDVDVEVLSDDSLASKKIELGVPVNLQSCHTSIVEGYVVEGHIPSEAIDKLLSEKPDIKGIALAGMPSGTPGMPGPKKEDWNIYALHHDGSTSIFMVI